MEDQCLHWAEWPASHEDQPKPTSFPKGKGPQKPRRGESPPPFSGSAITKSRSQGWGWDRRGSRAFSQVPWAKKGLGVRWSQDGAEERCPECPGKLQITLNNHLCRTLLTNVLTLVLPTGPLLSITRFKTFCTQVPTYHTASVWLASKERSQASTYGPSVSDDPQAELWSREVKMWKNLALLERAQEVGRCFPHPRRLPRCPLPWETMQPHLRAVMASHSWSHTRLTPVSDGNSGVYLAKPFLLGVLPGRQGGSEIHHAQFQLRRHTMQYKCLLCASHWRQLMNKRRDTRTSHSMLACEDTTRQLKPTTAGMLLQGHFISKCKIWHDYMSPKGHSSCLPHWCVSFYLENLHHWHILAWGKRTTHLLSGREELHDSETAPTCELAVTHPLLHITYTHTSGSFRHRQYTAFQATQ